VHLEQDALAFRKASSKDLFSAGTCTTDQEAKERVPDSLPEVIPLDSITGVVREIAKRRPVREQIDETLLMVKPENLLSTIEDAAAETGLFAPTAPVMVLAVVAAMEPFRGVKINAESVRILWTEDGIPRNTTFVLSRKSVASLLPQLAHALGKTWTEVKFDSEARDDKRTPCFLVQFKEPVSVGDVTVGGGSYRLLVITGSDSTRLVYLLSKDTRMLSDALGVFRAEELPLGTGKPWTVGLSRDVDGLLCISEIHTDLERLKVQTCRRRPSGTLRAESGPGEN
jgi:hypothetical protein